MAAFLTEVAWLALVAWFYLVLFHGGTGGRFWRGTEHEGDRDFPPPVEWPSVVAVIPARNEAETIGPSVSSLLTQSYKGAVAVVVVDDGSTDGTAAAARRAGLETGKTDLLHLVAGAPLPPDWSGKLWALHQGLDEAERRRPDARYVLLTDADICHDRLNLSRLVARAEAEHLDLVSLMVRLRVESFWDRLLVPAFVFFFQMLYPFSWVNDPAHRSAAAAGGCMLVRRETLERAGGIVPIRDQLIDDCALARLLKRSGGRLWLGLGTTTRSLRRYEGFVDIWNMVARTAYTQLRHSTLLLLGTVLGMALLFAAPPLALVAGVLVPAPAAAVLGGTAWGLMTLCYGPTVRDYGLSPAAGVSLPAAGVLYAAMTVASAWRHWRGTGGGWKGRTYARLEGHRGQSRPPGGDGL